MSGFVLLAAVVLLSALTFGVAELVLRWRRPNVRPRRAGGRRELRYPVVLAHGLFGFDVLDLGESRYEYFRGVPAALEASGARVHAMRVSPAAPIARRAQELAELVFALDAPAVNIVAHSMGGLDARLAIAQYGLGSRVASLTTIGTPHHGTPLADLSTLGVERLGLGRLLASLGLGLGAIFDLTTTRMTEFNRVVADADRVAYGSFVASVRGGETPIHALLLPGHLFLTERAGPNDGIVPVASQRWGEVLGEIAADHWAQIGWSAGFDAPSFYADLLRELRARGF